MKSLSTRVDELVSCIYRKAGVAARLVRRYVRKLMRVLVTSRNPEKRLRETIEDLKAANRLPRRVKDARVNQLVQEIKQEKGAVAQYVVEGLKAASSIVTAAALYKSATVYAAPSPRDYILPPRPSALRDLMFTPLGQVGGLMAAATGLSSLFLHHLNLEYLKAMAGTQAMIADVKSTANVFSDASINLIDAFKQAPVTFGKGVVKEAFKGTLNNILPRAAEKSAEATKGIWNQALNFLSTGKQRNRPGA